MITQKRLKELLDYDKDAGVFTCKISRSGSAKIGEIAGGLDGRGYIEIAIDNKRYKAHRLAWLYVYGEFPKNDIDHINRIRDDNRIINLRDATRSENCKNTGIRKNNTSGTTGVYWNNTGKRWVAHICFDKKERSLGAFKLIKDAIRARKTAEKLHGYL